MSKKIQTFISTEINDNILNEINKAQEHFKKIDCDVKWVKLLNIHLTIKFLGEIDQKKIEIVIKKLELITKDIRSIQTKLIQLGAFPTIEKPKVIWTGLEDKSSNLANLFVKIENELGKEGFKKEEHCFRPHITIGRIRSKKNFSALTKELKNYSITQNINQRITEIKLVKSTLTPKGPIYENLKTFSLQ